MAAWGRGGAFRNMNRAKLAARLKLVALVVVVITMVTPLRNVVAPVLPGFLWSHTWQDLHTLKLLRIHLSDLFYSIDRSPYVGPCDDVRARLKPLEALDPERMPVYTQEAWDAGLAKVKARLTADELWRLEHFRPSLTPAEQREMLYSVLVMAEAFRLFNVSYYMAEGTLLGIYRHHGFIPWDDDVDVMLRAEHWPVARRVLSCIPGFSLSMGRDFMWKFMWNRSQLWRYESFIRFPYVDIFPYNQDDDHLWPLTIWMKRDVIWRAADTFPGTELPLEGVRVAVPSNPRGILRNHYGPNTSLECASRIFKRKEREPFPYSERVRVPCSLLYDLYPFVFHETDPEDGAPVQVRKIGAKVLSTFKPSAQPEKR